MNEIELAKARKRVHLLRKSGRLREMREEAGLSQRDLARALKVSQPSVHHWERPDDDGNTPTAEHALGLLKVLELMVVIAIAFAALLLDLEDLEHRVLKVPEVAEILGVGERTAYQAIARGEIPAVHIGRRIVVSGAALVALMRGGGAAVTEPETNNDLRS